MSCDFVLDQFKVETPCSNCGGTGKDVSMDCFYHSVLPTKLVPLAKETGLYQCAFYPETLGIRTAGELLPYLNLANYRILNAAGTSADQSTHVELCDWTADAIMACQRQPSATISVSREGEIC